jgi:ABC-2 type transport system permease protein
MNTLLTILNMRAAMFLKGVTDRRWHGLGKNLATGIIFGGVAVGTFLMSRMLTGYMVHQVGVDVFAMHRLLAFAMFAFFMSIYTIGVLVSYATLYTSNDVTVLMSMPVSHGVLFMERAVENIVTSATTLTLLGAAAVLGYVSVFQISIWNGLAILFAAFLPGVLIVGFLAIVTMPPLILLASRIGVRWLLLCGVLVLAGLTWLFSQTMDPLEIVRQATLPASRVTIIEHDGISTLRWLPSNWVSWFIQAMTMQSVLEQLAYPGLLLGALAMVVVTADAVGRRWYYRSWLMVVEMRGKRLPSTGWFPFPPMEFGRFWGFRPHVEAVLKRDFWMFFRDPVQRLHLLVILALAVGSAFSLRSLEVMVYRPSSQVLSFLTVFLFIGLITSSLALRFVFPSVSLEGTTFWAVRTAPIALSRLYWMKFIIAFVLTLVPSELLVLTVLPAVLRSQALSLLGVVGMAGVVVALVSLNLGSGAYFATLREDNPIKVASSQGASITFLASSVVLVIATVILAVPAAAVTGVLNPNARPAAMTWALFTMSAVALLITVLSHRLGLSALRKDF